MAAHKKTNPYSNPEDLIAGIKATVGISNMSLQKKEFSL
jgi:hypothetical protein